MIIVTMADAKACIPGGKGIYCSRGIRSFFEKYNLDYSDFVKNGIDAEKLIATNDSMALAAVEVARGRQ